MSIDSNNINHPVFLNIGFFENILKSDLKDGNFVIECVKFTSGHIPGENYCSIIYRADVHFGTRKNNKSEKVSLLIKTECLKDEYKTFDLFGKETEVYTLALPAIHLTLQNVQIAPKHYYTTRHPADIIVLQDMSTEGYKIGDRVNGLDEEHCRIVLEKLANYHAGSMQLRRQNPKASKMFGKGSISNESSKFLEILFIDTLHDLAILVEQWPGFEKFSEKLDKLRLNISEILKTANQPNEDDIQVLLHNDLWTNNILFKYEDKTVVDALLIDFQTSYFCSLGVDIIHFLYTSPQFDVLENRRDILIQEFYYKPFKATLKLIGYSPIPSLDQVYKEIDKRELSGLLWAIAKLYLICMEKDASSDNSIDNLADKQISARIRRKGMASERYQKTMKYIFQRLERMEKI